MKHHYETLPPYCFWPNAVGRVERGDVDPVTSVPFPIDRTTRIATAGSCFAQHIARHLRRNGFSHYVTERAHPMAPAALAEEFGYGIFTARYGNVYTSRQLLQLFERAYGTFVPAGEYWEGEDCYVDPFRPRIQPGGFLTLEEFRADRRRHLSCVRRAFKTLDVLVFTLGLTEC